MDNANPTILNVSQLPSRAQKRVPRAGPDSKYDAIVLSHPAWADDLSDSDEFGGDVSNNYVTEDSLDEQEIYGACLLQPLSKSITSSMHSPPARAKLTNVTDISPHNPLFHTLPPPSRKHHHLFQPKPTEITQLTSHPRPDLNRHGPRASPHAG